MTSVKGQVRLFVALDLPQDAKDLLNETMLRLRAGLPNGIRWVRPDGIHLTLKFLGDVDAGMVEPLLETMGRVATLAEPSCFDLQLTRLGMFPNAREPRVCGPALAAIWRHWRGCRNRWTKPYPAWGLVRSGGPSVLT